MSAASKTITVKFKVADVLTDVTSMKLRGPSSAGSIGVRRQDTEASVVDAGTDFTRQSQGVYVYTIDGSLLVAGVTYEYWIERLYDGAYTHAERTFVAQGASSATIASYLTVEEADALAEEIVGVASYTAASTSDKTKALKQATREIDSAMRYQGRRYDLSADQVLEFPRVPYESAGVGVDSILYPPSATLSGGYGHVWDWDEENDEAVVPADVKLACLYQADSLLRADRDERMDARHDGVASQSADGLSESFTGEQHVLCRRAHQLMEKYRLRSGQMI